MTSVFRPKYSTLFYSINGFLFLIGVINKVIGFEKAWDQRAKFSVSILGFTIGSLLQGYICY